MRGVYETKFAWSPEAVADLTKWRLAGLSCRQIAVDLARKYQGPVSRSAVIGKAFRLGIEMPAERKRVTIALNDTRRKPKVVAAKARVGKDQIAERRVIDLIRTAKETRAAPAPAVDPDTIATAPCCLTSLRLASCRWPLNRTADNGETLFCDNNKVEGRSYCEGHAKRAYTKTQSPEQKFADQVQREQRRAEARAAGRRESLFGFGLNKRFA